MSHLPDAIALLGVARESVLQTLLPALPPQLHYEARMLANALAIAERELAPAAGGRDISADRELALAIRQGQHDDDPQVRQHLRAQVAAKLAVSNPRVLAAYAGN